MAGISITRGDLTAAGLRAAAGRTKDARAARRMLAIALVLEGADRTTAAATCGMGRQTLRDRVHRYNAGLVNRTVPPRPRRLGPEQLAELAARVEAGPDPVRDGVVRWRRKDLQRRIATASGVALHERSVGKAAVRIVFEPTGACHRLLESLIVGAGLQVAKVNPRSARHFGQACTFRSDPVTRSDLIRSPVPGYPVTVFGVWL